jgi:hypothetical protein
MNDRPKKAHIFYALLAGVISPPALAFLVPAQALNELSLAISGLAPFLEQAAAKTSFPEAAIRFFAIGLLSLISVIAILALLVRKILPKDFPGVMAIIERNEPLFSAFGIPLLRHRLGVLFVTFVLAAGTFAAQFLIGGDINACKGCTTSSRLGFLLINSLLLFGSFFFLSMFVVWLRLSTAKVDA